MPVEKEHGLKACEAFIKAISRTEKIIFLNNEVRIVNSKKIGEPVICELEAANEARTLPRATGTAYVYSDLIVVNVQSISRTAEEDCHPNYYEYISL